MSLTESSGVFAAVHESSINDLVTAICETRPHLLSYGSPAFVPASSVSETQMAAIAFPGSGGIQWHVSFKIPQIDLYDEDVPLAPELTLEKERFSVSTAVQLCVDCPKMHHEEPDPHEPDPHHGDPREQDPREPDKPVGKAENPICTFLEIQAIGHLVDTTTGGQRAIGFGLDAVEIIDITPDSLESVLECLIGQMLRAALAQIRLPLSALRAGAFTLTPTEGPLIELDRVLARGNL